MVSVERWGGLRIEPYDPDAKDGDGDGIVQEGTAWERPVGTRILDELGREIVRGATRSTHLERATYRDARGKTVEYRPKGASTPAQSKKPDRSSFVVGRETIGEMVQRSLGWGDIMAIANGQTPPNPAVETNRGFTARLHDSLNRIRTALRARFDPHVDDRIRQYRAMERRVAARYGEIDTPLKLRAALESAFPRAFIDSDLLVGRQFSIIETNDSTTLSVAERGYFTALLDLAEREPHIAMAMLSINEFSFSEAGWSDEASTRATAGVCATPDVSTGLPRIGFSLTLSSDGMSDEQQAQLLRRDLSVVEMLVDRARQGDADAIEELDRRRSQALQHEGSAVGMFVGVDTALDPNIPKGDGVATSAAVVAIHEWSHLRDFYARCLDAGIDLSEANQTKQWLIRAFTAAVPSEDMATAPDVSSLQDLHRLRAESKIQDLYRDSFRLLERTTDPDDWRQQQWSNYIDWLIPAASYGNGSLDNLTDDQQDLVRLLVSSVSTYSTVSEQELAAEFGAHFDSGGTIEDLLAGILLQAPLNTVPAEPRFTPAEQETLIGAVHQLLGWLRNERTLAHDKLGDSWVHPLDLTQTGVEGQARLQALLDDARTRMPDVLERARADVVSYLEQRQSIVNGLRRERDQGKITDEELTDELDFMERAVLQDLDEMISDIRNKRYNWAVRNEGQDATSAGSDSEQRFVAEILHDEAFRDYLDYLISLQYLRSWPQTNLFEILRADEAEVQPPAKQSTISSTLGKIGYPSIAEMGARTIEDMTQGEPPVASVSRTREWRPLPAPAKPPPLDPSWEPADPEARSLFARIRDRYMELRTAQGRVIDNARWGYEDDAMRLVVKERGFDRPPRQVTAEEADRMVAEGGIRLFRGVEKEEQRDALLGGEYYAGTGMYGSGIYCSTSPKVAIAYAGVTWWPDPDDPDGGLSDLVIAEMILPVDARIIDVAVLEGMMRADGVEHENLGRYAALHGYDAIVRADRGSLSRVRDAPEIVVLNRGILAAAPRRERREWDDLEKDDAYGRAHPLEEQDALDALTSSEEFIDADDDGRASMLRRAMALRWGLGLLNGAYIAELDAMDAAREPGYAFRNLVTSEEWLSKSPKEKLQYLRKVIRRRNDAGLDARLFEQLLRKLEQTTTDGL